MLKRTMASVFAICIALTAGSAAAQTCSVGVFADTDGTVNVFEPKTGDPFHVYVVLFTEDVVNAVSFDMDIPGLGTEIFIEDVSFGTTPDGFSITTANGYNAALGECAVGFDGLPVQVADFTMIMPNASPPRTLAVLPNPDEDPDVVVYSDCVGTLKPCDLGQTLLVETPVANEATSFGAVKSLYNN